MKIIIPGKPIAKARPKFFKKGNFVGTYSPQKTEEGLFLHSLEKQIDGHIPFSGPVEVILWFGMPRPKSHFGTGRNAGVLKQSAPKYPVVKPDEDNLKKFVYDCFNGLVWEDDRQVIRSISEKLYSNNPRTEILVREIVD